MTPSSKLSGRRRNAGTPKVTRSNYCPQHPPGHVVSCDVVPDSTSVVSFDLVEITFSNHDTGLPNLDPLDHVDIFITGGSWPGGIPTGFLNNQDLLADWQAPAGPGYYTITVRYYWSDMDWCQCISAEIEVLPP